MTALTPDERLSASTWYFAVDAKDRLHPLDPDVAERFFFQEYPLPPIANELQRDPGGLAMLAVVIFSVGGHPVLIERASLRGFTLGEEMSGEPSVFSPDTWRSIAQHLMAWGTPLARGQDVDLCARFLSNTAMSRCPAEIASISEESTMSGLYKMWLNLALSGAAAFLWDLRAAQLVDQGTQIGPGGYIAPERLLSAEEVEARISELKSSA